MKKSTGVLLVLIIVILIGVIGAGGYFWYKESKNTNTQIEELKNEVSGLKNEEVNQVQQTSNTTENRAITNDTKADNTTKNMTTPTNNNTNTSNTSVNGKYQFKSQTDNYYHEATIEISNQNETSINFSINAAHGMNVDNVNIGELKGKATKIEVPQDCVVPNATQYAYQFEETQDGNTAKIILVYTAHKMFEYVTVKEEYSNGTNPYAGHNVWFSGEYEKVN